jgi:hypothetical protein
MAKKEAVLELREEFPLRWPKDFPRTLKDHQKTNVRPFSSLRLLNRNICSSR